MTNDDTINRGVVTVSSKSGLQILDLVDGLMQITSSNGGESRKESFSFTKANFKLPPCNSHEIIELFFPVIAPLGTNDHELNFELAYEKSTKETFDIKAEVEIHFEDGIKFSHRVLTKQVRTV